ncbi:ABC-ATPase domain-containing protein [Saliterribacillus persicus]|nr:ABC-ATPase domain-containing protein [Saliterribacillus persicus]
MQVLKNKLKKIDGKGYKAYKDIQGTYDFDQFKIAIDYVQGDPFASPSKIRIIVPGKIHPLKIEWLDNKQRKIYIEDCLLREIASKIEISKNRGKGSGKSGLIMIDKPGQEILDRTAVTMTKDETTICLSLGLPANGRKINGREAEKLFFDTIPSILKASIFSIKKERYDQAAMLADQHQAIREEMKKQGWIAFVANGSILPRESGISNRPMKDAVSFKSPKENEVGIKIPHQGNEVIGMAIKKGITLIVGGGYHGKSTLLQALERGVYHHIRQDGREFVLTDPNAVKIRAEDGRQISNVDITAFINDLPQKKDTRKFTTENASGSTSQAANVVECIEAGATTLLIDEDTSATNFMIRDKRMQSLVAKDKEPITPFIDKIKALYNQQAVSTIFVMGGSGEYFDVADQVIMMDEYRPLDVTNEANEIAEKYPSNRGADQENKGDFYHSRCFLPSSLRLDHGKKKRVQAKSLSHILMGRSLIELDQVEQLVDTSQTRTLAEILRYLERKSILNEKLSLNELLDQIEALLDKDGLQGIAFHPTEHPGDLARPRRHEIAACLNRMRSATVKQL